MRNLVLLSCKIRLNTIRWRKCTDFGQTYVAIPKKELFFKFDSLGGCTKDMCLEKNVVFKTENSSQTKRSVLFPLSLLNVTEIDHDDMWMIIEDNRIHDCSSRK